MSLGQLLALDEGSKDFLLIIYDGKTERISIEVHRSVLKVNSPLLRRILNSRYQLSYVWVVPEGSLSSALAIVKYFYSRDERDLKEDVYTGILLHFLEMATTLH
jgi:hypothetical protein